MAQALKSELRKSTSLSQVVDSTASLDTSANTPETAKAQTSSSMPSTPAPGPVNSKFIRHLIGERLQKEVSSIKLSDFKKSKAERLAKANGGGDTMEDQVWKICLLKTLIWFLKMEW